MKKCGNCNSNEIEVDSARGDEVCTNCGSVLADNMIVSEVQFEENAVGSSSAVGQFVSAESKGGATGYGYGKFHVGTSTESREVTLRKAKAGISQLCGVLRLTSHCIETAHNFFKMALSRNLTRGRKNSHIYAACVYITCRTEGTSHLLIDISDALQICCYELGRTYLKLSQALCINIPSIDPCIYIMRFANRLEFGDKTHEVSMTAQRLVQRMKKDSIHSGRRPSGLCGAALLLASRMHDFSRKPNDIVRVVKIHESTLRKRLLEFGETPSSALTIEEFMSIDLEAEQEPPSFKAARRKDKERLQKLCDENEFTSLQIEIDAALDRDMKKSRKRKLGIAGAQIEEFDETTETDKFIEESTLNIINECLQDGDSSKKAMAAKLKLENEKKADTGLKPDLLALCTVSEKEHAMITLNKNKSEIPDDLNLEGLDDGEIDGYILTEEEAVQKDRVWNQMNAEYLKLAKEREERAAREREEGKPEKKKRRARKKPIGPSTTALDAIQKVLQEKKISTKINYDILKSLTAPNDDNKEETKPEPDEKKSVVIDESHLSLPNTSRKSYVNLSNNRRSKKQHLHNFPSTSAKLDDADQIATAKDKDNEYQTENEEGDDIEPEAQPEPDDSERLADLLNQGDEDDVTAYGEEPEEYY